MVQRVLIKTLKRWSPYAFVVWLMYMWISANSGAGRKGNRIAAATTTAKLAPRVDTKIVNIVPYQPHQLTPPSAFLGAKRNPALDSAPNSAPLTDQPISVLLLGYQRTGASFIGQLFNKYPGNFYVLDPVDGVYSAMYGTKPGWTVGADFGRYWNGTRRTIPQHETDSLTSALTSLLTCDLDHVPTEVMGHPYFQQFESMQATSRDYINCLRESEIDIGLICGPKLSKMCPEVFGFHDEAQERCLWALAKFKNEARLNKEINSKTWLPNLPVNATSGVLEIPAMGLKRGHIAVYRDPYSDSGRKHYKDYIRCVDRQRSVFGECVPELQRVCDDADVRAMTTTRLTMSTAAAMMKQLPNLHVVHLIRDPRAIVVSRSASPAYRSHYARTNLTKEARVYCESLELDLKIRRHLADQHPNRVYELINENFMRDKLGETEKVYKFLRKRVPKELLDFWGKAIRGARVNNAKISTKWKSLIEPQVEKEILRVCKGVFDIYRQFWM